VGAWRRRGFKRDRAWRRRPTAMPDFHQQVEPKEILLLTGALNGYRLHGRVDPVDLLQTSEQARSRLRAALLACVCALFYLLSVPGDGGAAGGAPRGGASLSAPGALAAGAFQLPPAGLAGGAYAPPRAHPGHAQGGGGLSGGGGGSLPCDTRAAHNPAALAAAGAAGALAEVAASCLAPPPEWALSRVLLPQQAGDPPLAAYHSVLLGGACAALFAPRRAGCAGAGAGAGDAAPPPPPPLSNASAVLVTHLTVERLPLLARAAARWGGCVSATVHFCGAGEWERLAGAWRADPALSRWVTVHALLGGAGPYPFNAARNVALEPLLPGAFPHAASGTRLAPWFALVDADGVLSASAAAFGGIAERLARAGEAWRPELAPPAGAPECVDADAPLPHNCGQPGFSGFKWAAHARVAEAARARSLCPHSFDAERALFLVASFDPPAGQDPALAEAIAQTILTSGDAEGPPEAAHAALARALARGAVTHQAPRYPDSYVAMLHWPAWLRTGEVGPMPVHYSYVMEPYFFARARRGFPLFDEFFRGPGWDKNSFFLAAAGAGGAPLVHLPDVFILNAPNPSHANGSEVAPNRNREANSARFWGWCEARGWVCRTHCTVARRGAPAPTPDARAIDPARLDAAEAELKRAAEVQGAYAAMSRAAGGAPAAADPRSARARGATCAAEEGWDYYQPLNPQVPAADAGACCKACAAVPACGAWTFRAASKTCWLKASAAGRRPQEGVVSGNVSWDGAAGGGEEAAAEEAGGAGSGAGAGEGAVAAEGADDGEDMMECMMEVGGGTREGGGPPWGGPLPARNTAPPPPKLTRRARTRNPPTPQEDWDYFQKDNPMVEADTVEACCAACASVPGCGAWTLRARTRSCWLKAGAHGRKYVPKAGLVSGNVTRGAAKAGSARCELRVVPRGSALVCDETGSFKEGQR
jgi:hypothetical protein